MRETKEILSDINELVRSKGYIYSLCMLILEDFHYDIEHLHEVNYRDHVGFQEISLLVGFLLHEPIDFSYPDHPKELLVLKKKSIDLLNELEQTLLKVNNKAIELALQGSPKSKKAVEQLHFFIKEGSIVESILYARKDAGGHPYNEVLKNKYKNDEAWMTKHCGFTVPQALQIIERIQLKLYDKFRHFYSFMVKNTKTRNQDFNVGPDAWQVNFYPYLDLFNELNAEIKETDISKMTKENWLSFFKNLLNLFTVSREDFGNEPFVDAYLERFTTDQVAEYNQQFENVGDFNFYRSQPILLLEPGGKDYLIPLTFMLYEILYEAPKDWMIADPGYQDTVLKHITDFGQQITTQILGKIYYPDQMFPKATITSSTGESIQVDMLCIIANKAMCIEVHTGKIIDLARYNNDKNVLNLLKEKMLEIQETSEKQKRFLLEGAKITDKDGLEIKLKQPINEVEMLGVTTKNCPTISQQANLFLDKTKDSNPIFMTIFELNIITHYLKNPFTFLYYLRQRNLLMNEYIAAEELSYLGYHLCHYLHPHKNKKFIYINEEYSEYVSRNYFPYQFGVDGWVNDKQDFIKLRWKNIWFSRICKQIKKSNNPHKVDILFHLYDISMEGIDRMTKRMRDLKEQCKKDRKEAKASIYINSKKFGLSYIVVPDSERHNLKGKLQEYCEGLKYKNKADFWIGIANTASSTDAYDAFIYIDKEWKFNKELHRKTKRWNLYDY